MTIRTAGLKGFTLVFILQNFGALLGALPIVLSVAITLKVAERMHVVDARCLSS